MVRTPLIEGGSSCDNSGISYVCTHVPMSPRARTSASDDWFLIKVSEKGMRSMVTGYPGERATSSVVSHCFLLVHQSSVTTLLVTSVSAAAAAICASECLVFVPPSLILWTVCE